MVKGREGERERGRVVYIDKLYMSITDHMLYMSITDPFLYRSSTGPMRPMSSI